MILAAVDLLADHPDPSDEEIREGLEGNLCRCTGYQNIVRAVRAAAHAAGGREAAPGEPSPAVPTPEHEPYKVPDTVPEHLVPKPIP
jgi:carbon-monoxide dehydrogenase small subunit